MPVIIFILTFFFSFLFLNNRFVNAVGGRAKLLTVLLFDLLIATLVTVGFSIVFK